MFKNINVLLVDFAQGIWTRGLLTGAAVFVCYINLLNSKIIYLKDTYKNKIKDIYTKGALTAPKALLQPSCVYVATT